MPFKSKAQRRKFYFLKSQGKMDQKTIDEWESSTPKSLPEKIQKLAHVSSIENYIIFPNHSAINFTTGFLKSAGGPGSGVSGDNTMGISFLKSSPLMSIGYRKKFLELHKPTEPNTLIDVSKIRYKSQEKMVPAKLVRIMENWEAVKDKPIDVIRDKAGDFHILDGHHRAIAAILLKVDKIRANVYEVPRELE